MVGRTREQEDVLDKITFLSARHRDARAEFDVMMLGYLEVARSYGLSWDAIAYAWGVSRQAATEWFENRQPDGLEDVYEK